MRCLEENYYYCIILYRFYLLVLLLDSTKSDRFLVNLSIFRAVLRRIQESEYRSQNNI
jgi:hypothetical protein